MSAEETTTWDLSAIGRMSAEAWQAHAGAVTLGVRIAALEYVRDTEAASKKQRDAEASAKRLQTRRSNEAKAKAAAPAPGQGEGVNA